MKITNIRAFSFHPIFMPLNQIFGDILDFGLRIGCIALLYHFY